MDRLLPIFKIYLSRFWPEALAFWAVSITASIWAAFDHNGFPDAAFATLEALAWFVFTLRLMQAETTFLTLGGWKARPISVGTLAVAGWALYFMVLIPPMLVRTTCLATMLHWTIQDWIQYGALTWLLLLGILLVGAAILAAIGKIARGGIWAKWLVILVGAGICWVFLSVGVLLTGYRTVQTIGGEAGSGPPNTPRGLMAYVPKTDRVIESFLGGSPSIDEPGLRLIARVPTKSGAITNHDGMMFRVTESRPTGARLNVTIEIRGPSERFKDWGDRSASKSRVVLAVRYANGMWGWVRNYNREWKVNYLAGFPIMNRLEQGEFLSPKMYPWVSAPWEELLDGAECYLFVTDSSVELPPAPLIPEFPMSIGSREMTVELPTLPDNPTLLQIRTATLAAVDQMQIDAWSDNSNAASRLLDKVGSAAVPFVLDCAPFGRNAWRDHLRRFLTKHATAEHVPALLKLLETDPRAAEVMIPKGWKNEALPLLRKHLENRLPLDYEGFRAMAELKDPSLAPHLAAQVLNGASNEFDSSKPPLLRDHPGIDWLALVKEGCRRSAMDDGEPNFYWLENSAPLGDRELFRKQVGAWLRNSNGPPSKGTIGAWIAKSTWDGESAAFPAWVRENFEKLRWDDALKRWAL